MQFFKAKLDDLSKTLTATLVIALSIGSAFIISKGLADGLVELFIFPIFLIISMVVTAFFRTTGYSVGEGQLWVHRPVGKKKIDLQVVEEMRLITKDDLGMGLRAFGSGGYFGYFGHFVYRKLGVATLYATDRNKFILLQNTSGKKTIVSPDDTEGFMATVNLEKRFSK